MSETTVEMINQSGSFDRHRGPVTCAVAVPGTDLVVTSAPLESSDARVLRVIGVSMVPGHAAVTPMPWGRSSSQSASDSPRTENFVAL